MHISNESLNQLIDQFVDDVLAPLTEEEKISKKLPIRTSLTELLNVNGMFVLWGGSSNMLCDLPHNKHTFTGKYKTCTTCKPNRDYCTSHTPLNKCVVCGATI